MKLSVRLIPSALMSTDNRLKLACSDSELLIEQDPLKSKFKENTINWMNTLRNGPLANKLLMVALIMLSRKVT